MGHTKKQAHRSFGIQHGTRGARGLSFTSCQFADVLVGWSEDKNAIGISELAAVPVVHAASRANIALAVIAD